MYRKAQQLVRAGRVQEEIRLATFKLVEQNIYPSEWQVRKALARPGALREPGARDAYHEALRELGIVT
jgi:hypothetical protein